MDDCALTGELVGGLGNQMFIVAFAYAMAKNTNRSLVFISGHFGGCGQGKHPSNYYNNIFKKLTFLDNVVPIAMINELNPKNPTKMETFSMELIKLYPPRTIIFRGYFQSLYYFRNYENEIRALFQPDPSVFEPIYEKYPELRSCEDIAYIGVRRGDYLKKPFFHNPCGMTYYKTAMGILRKKRYYIATDDIEWCKANFVGDQYVFFDYDEVTQLYAAMLFSNYIISNSSFHWWGSYLSLHPKPFVIAPDKWISDDCAKYIYRRGMMVLSRPIEI
jgi:hypothetical protein